MTSDFNVRGLPALALPARVLFVDVGSTTEGGSERARSVSDGSAIWRQPRDHINVSNRVLWFRLGHEDARGLRADKDRVAGLQME